MRDLQRLDLSGLLDLLTEQTNIYMKMLRQGGSREDMAICREFIIEVQLEIEARKEKTPITVPIGDLPESSTIDKSFQGSQNNPN